MNGFLDLAPASEPPKFGWHPWSETPTVNGWYIIACKLYGPLPYGHYRWIDGEWLIPSYGPEYFYAWSYIEPVPANLKGE